MSVIHNDLLLATDEATGYNLTKSLRFRSAASAYLNRTPASAGNRQKWTWSGWVKRGTLGSYGMVFWAGSGATDTGLYFETNNTLLFNANNVTLRATTQVFRDPSAWYHIVVALDTTQATAANRILLYVNGVQVTSFITNNTPTLNDSYAINNTTLHYIGQYVAGGSYFDGYLSEVNFVDGQQLTPSSFGETDTITGVWKPKRYTGTYGTNGFYLPFTDVATTSGSNTGLGKDFSGNGNYWNTNNISVTSGATYDSMTDVPTLTSATAANYCVLNALQPSGTGLVTPTNGNLTCAIPVNNNTVASIVGTIGVTSGKWYYEFRCPESKNIGGTYLGMGYSPAMFTGANQYVGNSGFGYGFLVPDTTGTYQANARVNGTNTGIGTAFTAATTDVFMVAADFDNGRMWLGRNGTWLAGDPTAGTGASITGIVTTSPLFPAATTYRDSSWNNTVVSNFGQQPFAYTPPTGFKALNTYNLPDSNIVAGNKNFDIVTYTGQGAGTPTTISTDFYIDLTWVKKRSGAGENYVWDTVRGGGNTKDLVTNLTAAEGYNSTYISQSFSSGDVIVDDAGGGNELNASGGTFVAWNWKAGQGTTSSNTNGSITSTVSANATAGFSIVTYTSPSSGVYTVGHGLGVAPSLIINKARGTTGGWLVWHSGLTGGTSNINTYLVLNATDAQATSGSQIWSAPTSTTFGLNGSIAVAANTAYVAYCWSEIAGFSKFGSYTGNGSTDGPFVYTGFRPKWIMIKRTDAAYSWWINDSTRDPRNVVGQDLAADSSAAESSDAPVQDFLSNGFKLRTGSYPGFNASGGTYIYMAFAENPFKNSLAR